MAKPTTKRAETPAIATTAPAIATYEITDKAPPYVAGQRVGDRKEIDLTEDQARAELLAGHIWPKGVERKAASNAA